MGDDGGLWSLFIKVFSKDFCFETFICEFPKPGNICIVYKGFVVADNLFVLQIYTALNQSGKVLKLCLELGAAHKMFPSCSSVNIKV